MRRGARQWLCLLVGMSCAWALPTWAQDTTPVDCGSAECEGIREMKTIFTSERSFLQETDRYTASLAELGFTPAPCADGSRAPVPLAGHWLAGCHFVYRITSVAPFPNPRFEALAQGAKGSPMANVLLRIEADEVVTFFLERDGRRRVVGWDECLPAESFTCAAQLREGLQLIRALFITERAFFNEKDRYSSDLTEIGFSPLGCTDGTRPGGPDGTWMGGCRFIFHVDLTRSGFVATGRAISGSTEGTTLKIDEQGQLTLSSLPLMCE